MPPQLTNSFGIAQVTLKFYETQRKTFQKFEFNFKMKMLTFDGSFERLFS